MIVATPPCTLAAARAAIVRQHPRLKNLADELQTVDPGSVDGLVCAGATMAVTIASGGTAGDTGFVLFRRTATGWRAALTRGGYKIALFRPSPLPLERYALRRRPLLAHEVVQALGERQGRRTGKLRGRPSRP
jgi:hypothetical protein